MSEQSLVVVAVNNHSLEESKAKALVKVFQPLTEALDENEDAYQDILSKEKDGVTVSLTAEAKKLRLKIRPIRTTADKLHKEVKAAITAEGRAIDGVRNAVKAAVSEKEEKLKEIEEHFIRIEAEKKARLQEERLHALEKYEVETTGLNLGEMSTDAWATYLMGVKAQHNERLEAERKAEEARIEEQRKRDLYEKRRNELIPVWQFTDEVARQSNLGEISDKEFKGLLDYATKKKHEHELKQEEIRKENERLQKEAAEREKKAKQEREKQELALRKEREEKAHIEAELKAKKEEEERQRKEAEEKERQAALAPDKDKLLAFVSDLEKLTVPDVKSKEALVVVEDIVTLVTRLKNFVEEKAETL